MSRVLIAIPAMLCYLTMAAHFLRSLNLVGVAVCLGLPLLLAIGRKWSILLAQWALLAGVSLWLWTMWVITQQNLAIGKPPMKSIIILTSVAGFHLIAALLLELPAFKKSSPILKQTISH